MSRMYSNTKKRSFKHLTVFQRGQIQALLEEGVPKARIARSVGISRSTLYNELKRGTVKQLKSDLTEYSRYFAETGQLVYQKHRQACRKPYKLYVSTFSRETHIRLCCSLIKCGKWSLSDLLLYCWPYSHQFPHS